MDQARIQELLQRIEKHPNNVLDRFALSKLYYDQGMWSETIDSSREILKLKPDYLVVHIQLGDSLLQMGKKDEAKMILEKAMDLAHAQKHQGMIPEIEDLLDQTN